MALLDPLTGIGNRRALQDHIAALPQVRGSGHGLAILVFDIDRFKSINDGHGHAFGDTIIVMAATVARKVLRGQDEVFRIGGEDFACVSPT
jgi:two-component system cell cycle response regulator